MPTYELTEIELTGVKKRPKFRRLIITKSASDELGLLVEFDIITVAAKGEVLKTESVQVPFNESMMRAEPGFMTVLSILQPLSRKMLATQYPELVVQ